MANINATSTVRNYDADWSWDEARLHFKTADPPFHHVLQRLNNPKEVDIKPAFESLARAIVGQQLSTKAAHTIWSRFSALYQRACNQKLFCMPQLRFTAVWVSVVKNTVTSQI